jgi:hypothetical protein
MTNVPEGAQLSDDGYYWWDGGQWQAVESGPTDGGLPPGGVPEQRVCALGPCPTCSEVDQMSTPCVYSAGHGAQHQCAYGDLWEQADEHATPLPMATGNPVATAILGYDSGANQISATGNTTGWPRGRIHVVGEIYCDNQLRKRLERSPCENSTSCELPTWTTTPDPGTHWELTVVGEGPRYSPVDDTDSLDVP